MSMTHTGGRGFFKRSTSVADLSKKAAAQTTLGFSRQGNLLLPALDARQDEGGATKQVVSVLRALDSWKVMEYWKLFDKNGNNSMDLMEFVQLLNGMRLGSSHLSKAVCSEVFNQVDIDRSGEIDLEEFLGWIFSLHSAYCGGITSRLGQMDPAMVANYFSRVDANGNGAVDRAEFAVFINKFSPESNLSRHEINELFSVIDIDHSGEIDASEFLNWVHPKDEKDESHRRSAAGPGHAAVRQRSIHRHKSLPQLSSSNGHTPAQSSMHPVALQFTTGPDFRAIMVEIKKAFRAHFGGSVKLRIVEEGQLKGCRRLVVQVGRGIVLWDRASMIMHRDDPFQSFDSARNFVVGKMQSTLPTLLRAVNQAKRRGA